MAKSLLRSVLFVVLVGGLALGYLGARQGGPLQLEQGPAGPTAERAFAEGLSDVELEILGRVDRVLADDLEGSRHQRFIVRLASGQTVLVAHNIDLAERVPLRRGDEVEARGEYEWNDRGGVLHWTHHDPQGRRLGGWIRHDGREYR